MRNLEKIGFISTIIGNKVIIGALKCGSTFIRSMALENNTEIYHIELSDFKIQNTPRIPAYDIIESALYENNSEYNSIIFYRDPFTRFCSSLHEDYIKSFALSAHLSHQWNDNLLFNQSENKIYIHPLYSLIKASVENITLHEASESLKNKSIIELNKEAFPTLVNHICDYLLN